MAMAMTEISSDLKTRLDGTFAKFEELRGFL
jgi:hypothetical protein